MSDSQIAKDTRSLAVFYVVILIAVGFAIWLLILHYRHAPDHATLILPVYSSLSVTATPLLRCETLGTGCRKALLGVINADRAAVGSPPLALDKAMTYGEGACIGAAGHARHMAEQGQLSHDQFPGDVCSAGGFFAGALSENVGASSQPERWDALLQIHELMMSEPYVAGCLDSHRCSLMYSGFRHIGIGYRRGGDVLYLAETFSG